MATDKNGKLTYEMKSPGDAWNDHVNKNMNADAATPAWANKTPDSNVLNQRVNDLNKKVDAMANQQQEKGHGVSQIDKWRAEAREKQENLGREKEKLADKNKEQGPDKAADKEKKKEHGR